MTAVFVPLYLGHESFIIKNKNIPPAKFAMSDKRSGRNLRHMFNLPASRGKLNEIQNRTDGMICICADSLPARERKKHKTAH